MLQVEIDYNIKIPFVKTDHFNCYHNSLSHVRDFNYRHFSLTLQIIPTDTIIYKWVTSSFERVCSKSVIYYEPLEIQKNGFFIVFIISVKIHSDEINFPFNHICLFRTVSIIN
jgi:hypothetical protein